MVAVVAVGASSRGSWCLTPTNTGAGSDWCLTPTNTDDGWCLTPNRRSQYFTWRSAHADVILAISNAIDSSAIAVCQALPQMAPSAWNLFLPTSMSRPGRDNICGGTYHVMNRGNRKAPIFEDVQDRRRFLATAIREKETYGVDILAGTEMGNHFHAIVTTPNGNLSEFMQQLEGQFARYFNRRHGYVGHVFQGRFGGVLIENDVHLLIALCYNFLNPVTARLVERPQDYKWSTYAATVGLAPRPDYLSIDWLLRLFPGASLEEAQRRLRVLMDEERPVTAYLNQLEEGVDPAWVRQVVRSYIGEQLQMGLLPRVYRSALRLALSELCSPGMPAHKRAEAIYKARVEHGYRLAEIARELRLSPAAVGKAYRSHCKSLGR